MINLEKNEFEKLVESAIEELPEIFKEKLDNVDVVVDDEPSKIQMKKMKMRDSHNLLGLYEGIPQIERENYTMVLPDKITIFKNSIERFCRTKDAVKDEVRKTVLHEIGHHFGMSEAELEKV